MESMLNVSLQPFKLKNLSASLADLKKYFKLTLVKIETKWHKCGRFMNRYAFKHNVWLGNIIKFEFLYEETLQNRSLNIGDPVKWFEDCCSEGKINKFKYIICMWISDTIVFTAKVSVKKSEKCDARSRIE